MATTTLWSKVKGWFSAPGAAPVVPRGTVLRAPDAEGAPVPAPTRQKPEDPPPGEVAVASNRAVKSCTVYGPGQMIAGRYAVERVFEGGMGYVYIAWDKTQNLRFAIKQPKAWLLDVPDFFARVVREADAWTGLGMHPHVAYCYFVRTIEDVPHIFVEYVDGGTLEDWIADGKCLDYRVGLELAIQCCHGMERAHGRGLLHRDLKPANILVTRDGQAKITDFGLVGEATAAERRQRTGAGAGETTYGTQMGTPEYMAPEQGRDPRRRSAKVPDGVWIDSDVYSFGVCLWEMVCGRRPFAHWSANTGQPPDPRDARRDLPDSLRTLLREVAAQDRTQRPQDFAQLRERLNGIYRELYQQDAPSDRIELLDTAAAELNNQGYSYYELGKPDEALACFRQAVEKDPTHPQAVYNLGLLQWRACEIDDMEVLRRMENCGNNPQNAKETLAELTAQVHAERSDPDAARACLQAYPGRFEALFGGVEFKNPQCRRTLTGHKKSVHAVALSGDGRRALSGSWDKTLKFWDLATGECLCTLTGHTHFVNAVALSGDGQRALSGGMGGTLKLWDLATGECLRTLTGHTGGVHAVALSGDGRRALSGDGRSSGSLLDNTLKLWDLETGACRRTLTGHTHFVTAVALSGNGRRALSGSEDQTLKLWDLETGKCLRTLTGHTHFVTAVALSGDGRRALSGSEDQTLKLWDLETGACRRTLTGHTSSVRAVALSGDGRRALSGSGDETLKLWDLASGAYRAGLQLAPHQGWAEHHQANTALKQALADIDAGLARGDYRAAYATLWTAWECIGLRPDAALQNRYGQLIRHGRSAALRVAYAVQALTGHTDSVYAVALSGDGQRALSGSGDQTLKLWDLETGKCLRTLTGHTSYVNAVALSGDGRRALSGSCDKTLKLWDLETGQCRRTLTGHTHFVTAVALSGVGRRALSGSEDQTLKLWDLETGACRRTLTGHTGRVCAVALSGDGRRALSGSEDQTLKLWDLETRECLRTLTSAPALSFHKGIWDLEMEKTLRNLAGFLGRVTAVALSGDGRRALSGSWEETPKLWDLETGECLRTLTGHTAGVHAVALSDDGRRALSGSGDQTLKLWDLETGECLRTLTGHTDGVSAVALSSDGRRALSGSEDKTLILWQLIWELEFPEQK